MDRHLYIYLAGTIKKGKEEKELEWTEKEMALLRQCLAPHQITFLNPATRSDDLSDQKSVFGRDLFQVYSSDLVLVDTREKRGLGVGSEMMFAKMKRIPVIAWLPEHSYYHRKSIQLLGKSVDDWIHPFIFNLSDYLAPSLEMAALWIEERLLKGNVEIKGPEAIQDSILYYLETQLQHDSGMRETVANVPAITQKMTQLQQQVWVGATE